MEVENLVLLVCMTLLLSFISSLFYRVTKIPDVIWLIGFGILMGSGIHYVDKNLFNELAPLMSILALSIILFEAGINVDIITLIDNMGKAAVLSILSILFSTFMLGVVMNYIFPNDFTLLQGMLLGAMVGGTSTVAVFGIFGNLEKSLPNIGSAKIMLTMESIISDPVCIIASITIIKMIMQPGASIIDGFSDIVYTFVLSSILGVFFGLLWSIILNRLRTLPHTYMITLAVLLPVYILSEKLIGDGAGAMTALSFGLAITNYGFFMSKMGRSGKVWINVRRLREFHEEIVFFIKSFFFVYIGVVVTITRKYMFLGLMLVLLLMIMRFGVVTAISNVLQFTGEETSIARVVYASGLPAFVISQLPQLYDPNGTIFLTPGLYPDICMPIVLGTILYSGLFGPWMINQDLKSSKVVNIKEFNEEEEK
ncbi:cation:proton antiporter [Thermoproteota archaeon]